MTQGLTGTLKVPVSRNQTHTWHRARNLASLRAAAEPSTPSIVFAKDISLSATGSPGDSTNGAAAVLLRPPGRLLRKLLWLLPSKLRLRRSLLLLAMLRVKVGRGGRSSFARPSHTLPKAPVPRDTTSGPAFSTNNAAAVAESASPETNGFGLAPPDSKDESPCFAS